MELRNLFRKVKTVRSGEVKEAMSRKDSKDFVLLDVREPGEYAVGHLPGAVHIPLSGLADRLEELDRSMPVVTY